MAGTVTVRFYALLRRQLKTAAIEVEADGGSLLELLNRTEKLAGQGFLDELLDPGNELVPGTIILVNGENVRLKRNLETPVRAGDQVDLFSPAGGG